MGKTCGDHKKAVDVASKKAVTEKAGKTKKSKKTGAAEIDDIFATARAKKRAVQEEKEHEQKQEEKRKQKMQKAKAKAKARKRAAESSTEETGASTLDNSLDPHAAARSARRRDEDGLSIYTMEELGITTNPRAGTTPLCPFDCDCCH